MPSHVITGTKKNIALAYDLSTFGNKPLLTYLYILLCKFYCGFAYFLLLAQGETSVDRTTLCMNSECQ